MNYDLLRKNFEAHRFTTKFFAAGAEAAAYLTDKLHGRAIGFGGSKTLRELGLYEALAKNNAVAWHHYHPSAEIRRFANAAKVYLTSANAVSMTGEIVNIDGMGNRLAMTLYGPDELYYLVGRNKIAPDLAAAMHRARNVAAPPNAQRLKLKTPCAAKADRCHDCNSPDRICNATLIVERPLAGMPTEVIFIDEDLGM